MHHKRLVNSRKWQEARRLMDVHEAQLSLQRILIVSLTAFVRTMHRHIGCSILKVVRIHCLTMKSTLLLSLLRWQDGLVDATKSQVVGIAIIELTRKRNSGLRSHLNPTQVILHRFNSLRRYVSMVGRTVFPLFLLRLYSFMCITICNFWTVDLALVFLKGLKLGWINDGFLLLWLWLLLARGHRGCHNVAGGHM